jgi:hypothetical protein
MELPSANTGKRCENAVWQLSVITDDSSGHLLSIRANGDTTVIYERDRMLHL